MGGEWKVDVYEAIYGRQSIRSFEEKNVSKELVDKLLEAACQAPTAGNLQPWRFYVVRRGDIKEKLVSAALGQRFVAEAPVVIVVCADLNAASWGYGERGRSLYALQDTAAAIENLLLAAYAEGLGTCWVGAFNEAEASRALNLPSHLRPVALIPLGYPRRRGRKASRRSVDEVTHYLE